MQPIVVPNAASIRAAQERHYARLARDIDLTRERVRQLQVEAPGRLRQLLEAEGLDPERLFGR